MCSIFLFEKPTVQHIHVTASVSSTKCSSSSECSIKSQEAIEMNCTILMYASICVKKESAAP